MKNIATVTESGNKIRAFDQKGNYMFSLLGKLGSFTKSNVSIKSNDGKNVRVYDSKGQYKYTR